MTGALIIEFYSFKRLKLDFCLDFLLLSSCNPWFRLKSTFDTECYLSPTHIFIAPVVLSFNLDISNSRWLLPLFFFTDSITLFVANFSIDNISQSSMLLCGDGSLNCYRLFQITGVSSSYRGEYRIEWRSPRLNVPV